MESDKNGSSGLKGVKNIFRALRYRNYRLFFGGQTISLIGTWMQSIAMSWLVYDLTNSTVLLGVVAFASQIPGILIAPIAGVLADRWDRKRIVIITQTLAMVQALILAALVLAHFIVVWHIIALSIFAGLVNGLDIPVRQTLTVEMIDKKEDLPNAIALNSLMFNMARLIGPAIAGIFIAAVGEGLCFLLNGLSYIAVILALFAMKIVPRRIETPKTHLVDGLKEGITYTIGNHPIRSILLFLSLISLVASFPVLMPVFARDILEGGPKTYAFLMGCVGIGALMGALFLASRKNVMKLVKWIAIASGIFGIALILFSFSRVIIISAALMVCMGFGIMVQMASSNTILQTIVDDDKRGRVMGFYTLAFMGMAPFGSLIAGCLAKVITAPYTLAISGLSCIAAAIFFAYKLPALKAMIHPICAAEGVFAERVVSIGSEAQIAAPPEK